ncbi:uncharacterized protein LOC135465568 isoform X2 [Liolophura sinensis]|uniref:uncharacterized protein LOC135465568 isoform X2 n=1 Tax=Liolophura sinensis TaxID=3198878 RepID=UPI0031586602
MKKSYEQFYFNLLALACVSAYMFHVTSQNIRFARSSQPDQKVNGSSANHSSSGPQTQSPDIKMDDPSSCKDIAQRIQANSTFNIPLFCFGATQNFSLDAANAVKLVGQSHNPRALQYVVRAVSKAGRNQTLKMINKLKQMPLSDVQRMATAGPIIEALGGGKKLSPEDIHALGSSLLQRIPGKFIRELPSESFRAFLNETFQNGKVSPVDMLITTEGNAVCQKAFRLHRTIDTMEQFDTLLPMLLCAPVSVCNSIPADIVKNRLSSIKTLPWNCYSNTATHRKDDAAELLRYKFPQMKGCAKALVGKLINGTLTADAFNRMGTLQSCLRRNHLEDLATTANCSELQSIAETVDLFQFSSVKKTMKTKCVPAALSNPQNMSAADLVQMGSLALDLDRNVLQKMDSQALCDSSFISMIKGNRNAKARVRKAIAQRCYTTNLSAGDIAAMGGEILLKLDISKLRQSVGNLQLDSNTQKDLKQALKNDKSNRRIKALRRELQQKFPVKALVDSPEIMKEMPLSRLKAEVVDIKQDLGLDDNSTEVDLPDAVNKWGVARWIENNPPENITAEVLREMKTLVRGFLSSHIKGLNRNDLLYSASVMCDIPNWPSKTVKTITEYVIKAFLKEVNATNYMSALTVTDVAVLGPECLMHLRPQELVEASSDVCVSVCQKIGASERTLCLPHDYRKQLKDSCLKCLGKHDSSTSITEDDLDTLGFTLASELRDEFSRTEVGAIRNRISLFRHGCLSYHLLKGISSKLKAEYGPAKDLDALKMQELGGLVGVYAEDNSLVSADKTVLAGVSGEILEDITPQDEKVFQNHQCCLSGLSKSETDMLQIIRKRVFSAIASAMDPSLNTNARRRKRQGSAWTCDDITSLGPSVTSLSVSDLQAIDATEFYNCVGVMSQYSDWEDSKTLALFQKVTNDIGHVCNLTTPDLVNVGYFLLSLTEAEINCLPLAEDDLVATLGSMSGWSTAKLGNLASNYLSKRSVTVSNLTSSDVAALGHILCGFDSADLAQLTSAAFVGASAQLGRLTSCNTANLQVLKETAVRADALGAINTWGAEIFSEIGVIIGGFTAQELQTLGIDVMEGIPEYAIPLIPGTALQAMSVEQLGNLTFEQASAVSSTQRQLLSSGQMDALQKALSLGVTVETFSESGSPLGAAVNLSTFSSVAAMVGTIYLFWV